MNEGKFLRDTKKCGHEFGLRNVEPRFLCNYRRILGNASENHGSALTICPSEGKHVEGICHDVPGEGLEAFLRKEGEEYIRYQKRAPKWFPRIRLSS